MDDTITTKISAYKPYLGDRYETFLYAFRQFAANSGKVIVELGTSRSFVSGGIEGCFSSKSKYWQPDKIATWDWGSGVFTKVCLECLKHLKFEFHSVDISRTAIKISKTITSGYKNKTRYHLTSSEDFLKKFNKKIDLLYMDAADNNEEGAQIHLREANILLERDLLADKGVILIDDINLNPDQLAMGLIPKGKYSIPFLMDHGYKRTTNSYQVILEKNKD
ncbi:MAG: hypothetical protein CVU78_02545 [Elusimicrobia bacterium HGW-Elusimicrobia-2]|nr:MAG: hypothetical protein CVU78_02545 [Elusimicrobia bacterium HGW-Elusimicrobia-2]